MLDEGAGNYTLSIIYKMKFYGWWTKLLGIKLIINEGIITNQFDQYV